MTSDIENQLSYDCSLCSYPLWINECTKPTILHEVSIGSSRGRKFAALNSYLLKTNCGDLFHADCISKRILRKNTLCASCSKPYSQNSVEFFNNLREKQIRELNETLLRRKEALERCVPVCAFVFMATLCSMVIFSINASQQAYFD